MSIIKDDALNMIGLAEDIEKLIGMEIISEKALEKIMSEFNISYEEVIKDLEGYR